ncbi:MAG: DUF4013 domain-containing protein [Methanobacterium sp.]|uniref:DUF4013 domain-containing protein n=1 Tax=Methanobacterium sp. TaxID=2164 RepID=UPI003D659C9F|nr:DUF4013 domain-containing protein [Methanobacterium sp.]
MDIVENITESIKYPLADWVKIVILTVISIVPIVNFMSTGYYLRIIKSTLAGVDEVPEFDNLGELFIDGIKVLIVGIVYMIIPMIIWLVALLPVFLALLSGSQSSAIAGLSSILTIVLMLIAFIVTIIMSLLVLPAIVNMGLYDGSIGAAFRFSEVMEKISTIGWGSYILWIIAIWITMMILGLIIGIIGFILLIIIIGPLLWILGGAYLTMFQARSVGLLFASSIE